MICTVLSLCACAVIIGWTWKKVTRMDCWFLAAALAAGGIGYAYGKSVFQAPRCGCDPCRCEPCQCYSLGGTGHDAAPNP